MAKTREEGREPARAAGEGGEHGERGGSGDAEKLSLYGYPQCPFCGLVLRTIDSLGLEIELRNTLAEPEHRRDLVEAVGRGTVPVLRIEREEGGVQWLPESADIVRYLEDRFGRSA